VPETYNLSLWLADLTLSGARDALEGRHSATADPNIAAIQQVLDVAANGSGATASWFDYLEAALHISERMLGAEIRGRAGNRRIVIAPQRRRGQCCGAYSTPGCIAQSLVQDAIKALGQSRRLRMIDLSLEAGQFPITTLANAESGTSVEFYAIDQDPAAIRLTKRLFHFAREYAGRREFRLFISCRDSLFDDLPRSWPRQFDAVIGNPPWAVQRKNYTERVRDVYGSLLSANFDLYLAFLLRADCLVRPGGVIAMTVPSTFLFNDSAQEVRKYLLGNYDVVCLRVHPRRSFVEVPCIIPVSFVLSKRTEAAAPSRRSLIAYDTGSTGGAERPRTATVCDARSYWQALPGQPFHPWVRPSSLALLGHIEKFPRLADFGTAMDGAGLQGGTGVPPEAPFTGYQARDLRPFHACESGSLKYHGQRCFRAAPKSRDIQRKKVLFQNFRFVTHSRRLIAAAASPGTYAVSTASMFFPDLSDLTDYWAAIFNSAVANTWFKMRDVSRTIKIDLVRQIPVPIPQQTDAVTELSRLCSDLRAELHVSIIHCTTVERQRVVHKTLAGLLSKIERTENAIESQVIELYEIPRAKRRELLELSLARVF